MKRLWKKATQKRDVQAAAVPPASAVPTASSSTATATASSSTAQETALANASSVFAILKDGGEMLKDVPYLKAIAGILNTIFKIWEEIKDVDSLTKELLNRVKRRSENLLQTLQKLVSQGNTELTIELAEDLKEYKELLEQIANDLKAMQASGSIRKWLQRAESRDTLHRHISRLGEFGDTFAISRLTIISAQVDTLLKRSGNSAALIPTDDQTLFKDGQPPAPALVLGRVDEILAMKTLLLQHVGPRLAILGPGGMGKTTVAQQLMNDEDVLNAFPTPLFISCENMTSTIPIFHAIADTLHIPAAQRGQTLQVNVVKQLRSRPRCLLCLDNVEDAWDPPSTRRTVEDLLTILDSIRSIGIIITMRGTERPRGITWTHPQPSPLEPLEDDAALSLFGAVSHYSQDDVSELLQDVDNVPLAINILGRLVEEAGLDNVLRQWKKEGSTAVDRGDGSDSRTTTVTASIELSLNSPRISGIPYIREVLAMLAILPDGLSEPIICALEAKLPPGVDLRRILQALRRVALCYLDSDGRYRLLAPIRQHIRQTTLLSPAILDALTRTFFGHVSDRNHTRYHDIIVPELANVRTCLVSDLKTWDEACIVACLNYLWWEDRILGIQDIPLVLEALSHADTPILQTRCRVRISQLLQLSSRHGEAREYLFPALSVGTGELYWEGCVRLEMGIIERMLNKFEDAAVFLHQAVALFKQANRPESEGVALEALGTLLCQWGHASEAEEPLARSLELARNAGDTIAEANTLSELGEVYRMTDRMSQAEAVLFLAIDCHQQSRSVLGEAMVSLSLGELQYSRGDLEASERSCLASLDLSVRIQHPHGTADALRWLGLVYSLMDGRLGLAEMYLKDALGIFQEISSMDNQAYVYEDLGDLFYQQSRFAEAISHWVISIAFHLWRLHTSKWERVLPICGQLQQALEQGR